MKNIFNSRLFCCLLSVSFCLTAFGQVNPVVKPLLTSDESNLELGISSSSGNVSYFSVTGKIPLQENSKSNAQIDRFANNARLVFKGTFESDATLPGPNSPLRCLFSSVSLEAGIKRFKYFPDYTNAKTETQLSLGGDVIIGYFRRSTTGIALSPQLKLRYSREWEESDEVGVVTPGVPPAPSLVKNMIVDAPGVIPSFTAGLGGPFQIGTPNIGLAVATFFTSSSTAHDLSPFANPLQRLKSEFWVHYYPGAGTGLVNTRIGLGLFESERLAGTDDFNKSEFGIMLQLKTGTTFVDFL